jgi:hypothetical protein
MSLTLAEKNSLLREAVSERLNRKLHHEEPDVVRPVTCCNIAGQEVAQPTTSQRFLDLLDEMRRLHESKSADYGSETDPLANIRQGAEFVGIEPWRGCMVRIADKVQRLKTYCRTGRLVHEGVRDTLLDLSAYSLLAIVLFDEGNDG